jgi:hypothetical protein
MIILSGIMVVISALFLSIGIATSKDYKVSMWICFWSIVLVLHILKTVGLY